MKRTRFLFLCALLVGGGLAFPAVRQVRVTAERAAVYAEPSRKSIRIDLVQKGALLNLFQQQKVKEIWYYVSYNSRRYGSRMSGFILDVAVEPVEEGAPPVEKPVSPAPEIKADEKKPGPPAEPVKPVAAVVQAAPEKTPPVTAQPAPKPGAARVPAAPEKVETRPAPTPELKKEEPKVVEYSEAVGMTPLPRAKRISLASRPTAIEDSPWSVLQPVPPEPEKPPAEIPAPAPPVQKPAAVEKSAVPGKAEITTAPEVKKVEPKIVESIIVTGITSAPRPKRLSLPRRSLALLDNPWAILRPAAQEPQELAAKPAAPETAVAPKPDIVKEKPKSAPSAPPAVRESAPEKKPAAKEKPADREPEKPRPAADSAPAAPQARPPRPVQVPGAARGPARLGAGLGIRAFLRRSRRFNPVLSEPKPGPSCRAGNLSHDHCLFRDGLGQKRDVLERRPEVLSCARIRKTDSLSRRAVRRPQGRSRPGDHGDLRVLLYLPPRTEGPLGPVLAGGPRTALRTF